MTRMARFNTMETALKNALHDMRILAGEIMAPSGVTWQDVAGTCATNFEVLAAQLHAARTGNTEPFISFPSPAECLDTTEEN